MTDNEHPVRDDIFFNRKDQIISTINFVLDNPDYVASLRHVPNQLTACAIKMFREAWAGYHAAVIRTAIQELEDNGCIAFESAAYSHSELFK